MTRPAPPRPLAAAALALALAGCGHSPPTRLYTLETVPPAVIHRAYAGAAIRVDAVRVPPALDRLELMQETAPGEFRARDLARWAAPPGRLARLALSEDLTLRLPAGRVALPDGPFDPRARRLSVTILAMSVRSGSASLSAGWSLSCPAQSDTRTSRAELQAPGDAGEAAAYAGLLGRLADAIAAQVEADAPAPCDPAPTKSR